MAGKTQPTIKMVWGIAKSKELALTDDELHLLVAANTGKDSIRKLDKGELRTVIRVLVHMKKSAGQPGQEQKNKTGNVGTERQRAKIYSLAQELGWETPERVNGLCRKMFSVDRVEWLDYTQCSKLIEALKGMNARKGKG